MRRRGPGQHGDAGRRGGPGPPATRLRRVHDTSRIGAFLIPKFFATAIQQGAPETPFFIFGAYYFTCIVVNWWFYLRIHPNSIKPGTAPQSAKAA